MTLKRNLAHALLGLLCVINPLFLQAAVLDRSDHGFVMESRVEVAKTALQSYQQFVQVAQWWDADHSWFGEASGFSIEPVAGGCFCEIDGGRQVQHMQVVFVDPGNEIRLLGALGPMQGMGVHGSMSWKFNDLADGGAEIVHSYAVSGFLPGGLDKLADVVDQVQTAQLQNLAGRLQAE